MKLTILIILVISIISCGTPKFYNEIKSTYESYDFLVSKYGKEAVNKSSYDPHKLVLNKLSSYLHNSNHIIYHYSRTTTKWKGKEFSGVVYDVDNNKYYYVYNNEITPRKIKVDFVYMNQDDNYYKFIIQNYLKGKIDYLKKLGEFSNHSGYRISEVIYDINLKYDTIQKHVFSDFFFMDGKPTLDIEW